MKYEELLDEIIGEKLIRIVLSKAVNSDEVSSIKVRPIKVKEKILYQMTKSVGSKKNNTYKEVHENYDKSKLKAVLLQLVPSKFMQGLFETEEKGYTLLSNKKGTITVVPNKTVTGKKESLEHNRIKNYLLPEGEPVPFLIDLGVQMPDGKITKAKYDKFKQINRYLEFVEDTLSGLNGNKSPVIIDFGCGKSYLTFALYYYLTKKKGMTPKIIGLDLKTDVIKECNRLKNKYKYENLTFIEGDIEHFAGVSEVDMVITLHACDTATDYALYKAIKWDAKVIMAVPCCQHELNKKINIEELDGVLQYGLLKERMSSIFTDAIRANTLREYGYDTQILEFIDMEHTPKNLLIRGVKTGKIVSNRGQAAKDGKLQEVVGTTLTLTKLLKG